MLVSVFNLVFTLTIFLNSVESRPQPPSSSGRDDMIMSTTFHRNLDGTLTEEHLLIDRHTGREYPITAEQLRSLLPLHNNPEFAQLQRNLIGKQQKEEEPKLEWYDGDYMYRGGDPIGKIKNEEVYKYPEVNGIPELADLKSGDRILHDGAINAVYEDKEWHPYTPRPTIP